MTPAMDLERLATIEFEAEVVASVPSVLRVLLARRPEVCRLREAYETGCLPDEQVREYVSSLLCEGAASNPFRFQIAFAAMAVVLEAVFSPLAEEYLTGLGRIRASRFSHASGVARVCSAMRRERVGTVSRTFPAQVAMSVTCDWTLPDEPSTGAYYILADTELKVA